MSKKSIREDNPNSLYLSYLQMVEDSINAADFSCEEDLEILIKQLSALPGQLEKGEKEGGYADVPNSLEDVKNLYKDAAEYFDDSFEDDSAEILRKLIISRIKYAEIDYKTNSSLRIQERVASKKSTQPSILVEYKTDPDLENDPVIIAELTSRGVYTRSKTLIKLCLLCLDILIIVEDLDEKFKALDIKRMMNQSQQSIEECEGEIKDLINQVSAKMVELFDILGIDKESIGLDFDREDFLSEIKILSNQVFMFFNENNMTIDEFNHFCEHEKIYIVNNVEKVKSVKLRADDEQLKTFVYLATAAYWDNIALNVISLHIFDQLVIERSGPSDILERYDNRKDFLCDLITDYLECLDYLLHDKSVSLAELLELEDDKILYFIGQSSIIYYLNLRTGLSFKDLIIDKEKLNIITKIPNAVDNIIVVSNYYFIESNELFALDAQTFKKVIETPYNAIDVFYQTEKQPLPGKIDQVLKKHLNVMHKSIEELFKTGLLINANKFLSQTIDMAKDLRQIGLSFHKVRCLYDIIFKINKAFKSYYLFDKDCRYFGENVVDINVLSLDFNQIESAVLSGYIKKYLDYLIKNKRRLIPQLAPRFAEVENYLRADDFNGLVEYLKKNREIQIYDLAFGDIRDYHLSLCNYLFGLNLELSYEEETLKHFNRALKYFDGKFYDFFAAPYNSIQPSLSESIINDSLLLAQLETDNEPLLKHQLDAAEKISFNNRGFSILSCSALDEKFHAKYQIIAESIHKKTAKKLRLFNKANSFNLINGETLLSLAIKEDNIEVVMALIVGKYDLSRPINSKTPLELAGENKGPNKVLIMNELRVALEYRDKLLTEKPAIGHKLVRCNAIRLE